MIDNGSDNGDDDTDTTKAMTFFDTKNKTPATTSLYLYL